MVKRECRKDLSISRELSNHVAHTSVPLSTGRTPDFNNCGASIKIFLLLMHQIGGRIDRQLSPDQDLIISDDSGLNQSSRHLGN